MRYAPNLPKMSRRSDFTLLMPLMMTLGMACISPGQTANGKSPLRIAVVPAIADGPVISRMSDLRSAGIADTLARALSQVQGVIVSNPVATYHATLSEAKAGGPATRIAARVARRLQANQAILVETSGNGSSLRLSGTPVLPFGDRGKPPAPFSHQGALMIDTDAFKIQEEFVRKALAALSLKPTDVEDERIKRVVYVTASLRAFDLYVAARQQMSVASLETYDSAVLALQESLKIDKEFALAHAALAEAATFLTMQQALVGLRDSRLLAQAIQAGETAVKLCPELSDTHRALALACAILQRSDKAAAEARAALAIRPQDPEATLWLGLASGREGKPQLTAALEMDPSMPLGHLFLAALAVEENDGDLMVAECRKALDLSPYDPSPSLLIGAFQTSEGKVDQAIATYKGVLRINPRTAVAYAALARLYLRKGQDDEARESIRQAISLDSQVPQMIRSQAASYQEQGYREEAEKEYRLMLMADERDGPSWRALGNLALQRDNTSDAEQNFRKALEIDSKDSWAMIGLSRCRHRQGKTEQAMQDLRRAAEAHPEDALVQLEVARIYEQRQQIREAAEAYDKVVQLVQLTDAYFARARIYEKLYPARAAEAWTALLKAIEASGGPHTDTEKEQMQVAAQRLQQLNDTTP